MLQSTPPKPPVEHRTFIVSTIVRKRGTEIHGSQSSMEDWDADLSPCRFATTGFSCTKKQLYLPATSRPSI